MNGAAFSWPFWQRIGNPGFPLLVGLASYVLISLGRCWHVKYRRRLQRLG
jgi:hypothetical protein